MKKGIFIISFILICYFGYAQYPITSNLGGPTTLVQNPNYGGLRGGLIPFTFADTTAASLTNLKYYAGALIYTSSPRAVWWRDLVATAWVQVLPSGGSTGTLAWVMGGNNPVVSDGSGNAILGAQTNNGVAMMTNNLQRVILPASGLSLKSVVGDTTLNKPMVWNTSTKEWNYAYWFSGSSATPDWQTVLTAGSALTTNNNITGAFAFSFTDPTSFKIVKSTIERLSITNSLTTIQGAGSTGASLQLSSSTAVLNSTQLTELSSGSSATSQSLIDVHSDSIEINPYLGNLRIDTLTNLSTQNTILGWVQGSGQGPVGYITVGAGLSLSGGALTNTNPTAGANTALSNLASVAINTSLISDANNTDDLGSNTVGWRYGYFASAIGIGSGLTTPSAALDIRAADLFLTSSSVDQRFIIGEGLVSATDFYAISWNRTDNQLVFNDGGVAVSMRLEGDANANLFFADATNDRIGIGDATPASLFTVGSGDLFQVNTSGDLVKLKNVTYSWPSANAAGALTNDGSGNLSFAGYVKLTGTSTLTGNVSLAVQDGPYSFSVLNNSDRLLVIDRSAGFYGIGDMDNAAGNTWIKVNDATQTLFFKSSAITAGNAGDALTVVDPSTGEIGVQPNLAFQLHKQGTDIGATDGKVWVSDSVGNKTIISPHYFPSDIKPSEEMAWSFYSRNEKIGKEVFIDMLLLARKVEELTGEKLVYIKDIKK